MELLLQRDNTLRHLGASMVNINLRTKAGSDGIVRYFWRVVEDDYLPLFLDNTLEVFLGKNHFVELIQEYFTSKNGTWIKRVANNRKKGGDFLLMKDINKVLFCFIFFFDIAVVSGKY